MDKRAFFQDTITWFVKRKQTGVQANKCYETKIKVIGLANQLRKLEDANSTVTNQNKQKMCARKTCASKSGLVSTLLLIR